MPLLLIILFNARTIDEDDVYLSTCREYAASTGYPVSLADLDLACYEMPDGADDDFMFRKRRLVTTSDAAQEHGYCRDVCVGEDT